MASTAYALFVGIDVAATSVTVTWTPTPHTSPPAHTLPQSEQGFTRLRSHLQQTGIAPSQTLIVMEATGTYWMTLATKLQAVGYHVSIINPAQAHYFAKALLKRAKTDTIDAQTLARLAAMLQPEPWTPPPAVYYELQQRLAQRDTFLLLRTQLRNQLHALDQNPTIVQVVRERMLTMIQKCTEEVAVIDAELTDVLNIDTVWAAAAERLQSIPGIGQITAAWLLVTTLNFTTCATPEAATAYAGLAPYEQQSGTSVYHRPSIGHAGNSRLRTALYMATLSAAQYNPIIKRFYKRLREKGKPPKVARCAAARKLLHIAWAVVTKQQRFDPAYGQAAELLPTD